jgi:hypothetical protein
MMWDQDIKYNFALIVSIEANFVFLSSKFHFLEY